MIQKILLALGSGTRAGGAADCWQYAGANLFIENMSCRHAFARRRNCAVRRPRPGFSVPRCICLDVTDAVNFGSRRFVHLSDSLRTSAYKPPLYRPKMKAVQTADDEVFILLARCRGCINIDSCGCCWSRMTPKFRGFSEDR